MSIAERIRIISERWFMFEPLLFMTLMSHELTPNNQLRYKIRSGQGRIEYNLDDAPELSDDALEETLRAEMIRILLRHPYRHHGKNDVAYMASNITLNENYDFRFLKYKARDFWGYSHWNKNFEFYYRELLDMKGDESSESSESSDGSDNTEESGELVENSLLWQEDDFIDQKIKEIIEWAEAEKRWGTLSGDIEQILIASLRPEIDYRKIMRAFRASVIASDKMLTRFKPSRRYGFEYMGKKNQFRTSMLVAVDVSGSVSGKDLQIFYSAINRFFKYGIQSLDVLQFDCEIKEPLLTVQKAKKSVKIHGRGGTDFQAVIDFFEKSKSKYDGLIIFTDGYAKPPEMSLRSIRKTLWICDNKRDYQRHKKWMERRGRCCWIKDG